MEKTNKQTNKQIEFSSCFFIPFSLFHLCCFPRNFQLFVRQPFAICHRLSTAVNLDESTNTIDIVRRRLSYREWDYRSMFVRSVCSDTSQVYEFYYIDANNMNMMFIVLFSVYSSARTIRHRVAFSMANFVRPFLPAIRPMARERWSPFNGLTRFHWTKVYAEWHSSTRLVRCLPSLISNDSRKRSSRRINASPSSMSKPSANALTKSARHEREMTVWTNHPYYFTGFL
jgi:hypothetical protein